MKDQTVKSNLPKENLPTEALVFFHRVTMWVQAFKKANNVILEWRKGIKKASSITCIKQKKGKQVEDLIGDNLPLNTLYIPCSFGAKNIIKQLRNAFCHDSIKYIHSTGQYEIRTVDENGKLLICGSFSLQAIESFVEVFLNIKNKNVSNSIK